LVWPFLIGLTGISDQADQGAINIISTREHVISPPSL
jgi:hypothetical protein